MKFYNLDTKFTYGKHEGKTVRQIVDIQPSYLDWCAINLDHFYMTEYVIEEIKEIKSDFVLSTEGLQKLDDKFSTWEEEQVANEVYDEDDLSENYDDVGSYADQTDWTHYDDALDMDQQSIEFWNQF